MRDTCQVQRNEIESSVFRKTYPLPEKGDIVRQRSAFAVLLRNPGFYAFLGYWVLN